MSSPSFRFRQFTVQHDRCAMKVGTDAVLLGAWADAADAVRILDVGAGCGVIGLMMAQRYVSAHVTEVEIDADAARQAAANVAASPWADRMDVVNADFTHYCPPSVFGHIVSNPPYFDNSLCNPDPQRSMARHSDTLAYEDLFCHSARVLECGGRLSMVFPADMERLVKQTAWRYHLFPSRQTNVYTKPGKPCRRILLELWYNPDAVCFDGICRTDNLYLVASDGSRSAQYAALTADFYL